MPIVVNKNKFGSFDMQQASFSNSEVILKTEKLLREVTFKDLKNPLDPVFLS